MTNDQTGIDRKTASLSSLITYCIVSLSLRKLKKIPPHTVRFHLIRGRILFSLGQYDQAISDFRSVLRLDWRHHEAALWLNKAMLARPHTAEISALNPMTK